MTSNEFKELWNKHNNSDSISERKQINEQLVNAIFDIAKVIGCINQDIADVYNICDITLKNQMFVPHNGQKCEITNIDDFNDVYYWSPVGAYSFKLSLGWLDNLKTKAAEYEKTLLAELLKHTECCYFNLKRNLKLYENGINSITERLKEIEASSQV